MEKWLSDLYKEGADVDLGVFTKWIINTVGSWGSLTLIFMLGLLTLLFVVYVKMSRSFVQGLIITLLILVLGFFAYYFVIFKTDYPSDLMLETINSSSSHALLEEMELQRMDVQSVAVSPLDEQLDREEIAIIGEVNMEQLKKLMFTIRDKDNKLQTFTLYGYVSEQPSTDRKDYITYYKIDKSKLLPEMRDTAFFQHDMYNIVVYKRENNLAVPTANDKEAKATDEVKKEEETKTDTQK